MWNKIIFLWKSLNYPELGQDPQGRVQRGVSASPGATAELLLSLRHLQRETQLLGRGAQTLIESLTRGDLSLIWWQSYITHSQCAAVGTEKGQTPPYWTAERVSGQEWVKNTDSLPPVSGASLPGPDPLVMVEVCLSSRLPFCYNFLRTLTNSDS